MTTKIGKVKKVKDFLPTPEELAFKDETVKITISLSKASIDFFKKEAGSNPVRGVTNDRNDPKCL